MRTPFKPSAGRAALLAATGLFAVTIAVATRAQAPAANVWGGVYTADQASRGKAAYMTSCASCHGPALAGGDSAPALIGGTFLNNWNSTTTGDLFSRIHDTMPANDPGSLGGKTVSDIEAFIFQANGFPAGTTPLPSEPAMMAGTKILGTKPAG
ncbi:cytochrome c [Sphingomonas oligophenolica]|uniref:C-type cytochrome n=1 Tax=Sphingomonas oligophenolica TaxID=301154 RepID=A0ABU9Y2T9_9SPHN